MGSLDRAFIDAISLYQWMKVPRPNKLGMAFISFVFIFFRTDVPHF
uniref:Uncharacterized protein n=1 Tax=Picea glauca TaxID=3330 RepID=A0A117NHM1_PICGL|nr:hypothetical protein ABT39_MTgene4606 [Picea glauca]